MNIDEILHQIEQRHAEMQAIRARYVEYNPAQRAVPCNRAIAEDAVRELYRVNGYRVPNCVWFDAPDEGFAAIALFDIIRNLPWSVPGNEIASFTFDTGLSREHDAIARDLFNFHVPEIPTPDRDPRMKGLIVRRQAIESANALLQYTRADQLREVRKHILRAHLDGNSPHAATWQRFDAFVSDLKEEEYAKYITSRQHIDRSGGCIIWREGYSLDDLMFLERPIFHAELAMLSALGIKCRDDFDQLDTVLTETGWLFATEDVCIMIDRPLEIHLNPSTGRLHHETDMAMKWRNGWGIYAIDDVAVTKEIVDMQFTAADIDSDPNVERRRIMLNRYGIEKYIRESNARIIHQDSFGVLYSREVELDELDFFREPICAVRVRNSTPEPDGSYKEYFLRVPPGMRTAREAVAWTFGFKVDDYDPLLQT